MNTLTVYLHDHAIGLLESKANGNLRFTYSREWLERDDAIPLSRMLPLSPDTYEDKYARPYFAGILPEQAPRAAIARILGISEGNDFAMLEQIGGECAGAVTILPEGMRPSRPEQRVRVLDDAELISVVEELPRRPLMAGEDGIRLSLAGAQNKLPIVVEGDAIALPLGNTPSTHIIKPEPDSFPGLVVNEAYCMALASRVGLDAAPVLARKIGAKNCIIVTRYDRVQEAHATIRLHQEDFCQALGYPPERKYQKEGGPTAPECVTLLREWTTVPVVNISSFIDALGFNLLIGNADAHGKNYSILYSNDSIHMAPLYDLVSTIAWPELSTTLAMSIGKGKMVNDINPAHFKRFAQDCKLGWPMVRDRLENLAANIMGGAAHSDLTIELGMHTSRQVSKTVQERCERMMQLLRVSPSNSSAAE